MKHFSFQHGGVIKSCSLPDTVSFIDANYVYTRLPYNIEGFRCPKKGEYFLSGAEIEAYIAPNDLSTEYIIVTPIKE